MISNNKNEQFSIVISISWTIFNIFFFLLMYIVVIGVVLNTTTPINFQAQKKKYKFSIHMHAKHIVSI